MLTTSKISTFLQSLIVLLALSFITVSCQKADRTGKSQQSASAGMSQQDQQLATQAKATLQALPDSAPNPDNPVTPVKVELGKKLYFDTRLSRSNTISCNSCHNLATYGVDNNVTSMGHGWRLGPRNSPTVLNAALHMSQFWDGRANNVEEQAKGPIMNPIEMGGSDNEGHKIGVARIASIDEYVKEFKEAFPQDNNDVTLNNIADAIGAFERTLLTPSPFDQFLNGQEDALSNQQKEGLKTFMQVGCNTCHNGPAVGGSMYQKFGLVNGPYWEFTGSDHQDTGRYDVTGNESDKYFFKVPSLRNIVHTYPYFHDGSVWDLRKAVRIMSNTQLGTDLSDQQVDNIIAFLHGLTGKVPADVRTLPLLPPSGPDSPKPQDKVFTN